MAASQGMGLLGNEQVKAQRPGSVDIAQSALSSFYGGGGNAGTLVFNYSPTISTASQYEAQQQLKPMIEQILRQGNGR